MFLRLEKCDANDSLAHGAGFAARVGSVVGSLASERRQPEDGEDGVYHEHDIWIGRSSCPLIPGRQGEINPCRDGQKALQHTRPGPSVSAELGET